MLEKGFFVNKSNVVLFLFIILPIIYISLVSWEIYNSDAIDSEDNNQMTTVVETSIITTTVTETDSLVEEKTGEIEKGSPKQEEPKTYNISET